MVGNSNASVKPDAWCVVQGAGGRGQGAGGVVRGAGCVVHSAPEAQCVVRGAWCVVRSGFTGQGVLSHSPIQLTSPHPIVP